jgi:hypothetical protein
MKSGSVKPSWNPLGHTGTVTGLLYLYFIQVPSWPVYVINSFLFHYCISHATVCTCSGIRDDKMQPVYTDTFLVPLPHRAISYFNLETIFSVNVLSVGSSNNTDESHTNRMLTVSRHWAGHHCPSGLWKLQFTAVSHNWQLGASVSNSVFHNIMFSHPLFKNDGQNFYFHHSYYPLYKLLVADVFSTSSYLL